MAKTFSGEQVIKILIKHFGFAEESSKGSHIKLNKLTVLGKIVTIVPLHKELSHGTLRGVLELAQIEYRDFIEVAR